MTVFDNPQKVETPEEALQAVRHLIEEKMDEDLIRRAWLREDEIIGILNQVSRRIKNEKATRNLVNATGVSSAE